MNLFRAKSANLVGKTLTITGTGTIQTPVFGSQPTFPTGTMAPLLYADITVTTGQLLALHATPKTVVAAAPAGFAHIVERAQFFLKYNSIAYDGIAAGEDLAICYTNASGAVALQCETTGFLDATADARRVNVPANDVAPVTAAVLVVTLLVGEIATGNSPLYVRVWYRTVAIQA